MTKKTLVCLSLAAISMMAVTTLSSCGGNDGPEEGTTAYYVKEASKMTLSELEAAAKAEMEASTGQFKVVALTSTMSSALKLFSQTYDWLPEDKWSCDNSYKDAALLSALEIAETDYFADFALIQDARSLGDLIDGGITHNYVPSDHEAMGLAEKDTFPLKGIYFNKIFYISKNTSLYKNKGFYNIWQVAGSPSDEGHLDNFSFQNPTTESINMSFLISCMAEENQDRIEAAYKSYYGKDWSSTTYDSCGEEFVYTLMDNVTRWHSSDGTTMKETCFEEQEVEGQDPYVYYGAYSKMKDAAKISPENMAAVGWDLEIEGFNSFMYCMYSQVINNAQHPYTACLFARFVLTPDCYKAMCYNKLTPNADGTEGNQYGYYYPCTNATIGHNTNDWTTEKWIEESIVENYEYLKSVPLSVSEDIKAHIA